MTESQLREVYRNASDEELLFLAREGSSRYTDTAWALLRAEMTRRGLAPASGAQEPERADAHPPEKGPIVLPLQRWGEVPGPGVPERFEELSDEDRLALAEEETAADSCVSGERIEPEAPPPAPHVARPVFTGRGEEYFRIWVVNLLLTLLTVGLYSAWAKVRKARYFRQNTRLDGHVFGYHANPVAILRGRLLALVLLAAYTWAFQFSNRAGLLTVTTLCLLGPWLLMRAQRFALANTSFRGLRFGFRARAGEAYEAVLPVLALWLLPDVTNALTSGEGWSSIPALALTLAFPWMHHRLKAFQRHHAVYGDRQFAFTEATRRFYAVYAKGLGLVLVAGLLAAMVASWLVAWRRESVGSWFIETVIYGGIGGLFMYVVVWPYLAARLQEIVWSRTRLGDIRFRTEIQALPLFHLVLKNVALTLVTCGLYWPWAAVALARYRIECMRVESSAPLSALAAGLAAAPGSAAGEGAADAFGIDIGL